MKDFVYVFTKIDGKSYVTTYHKNTSVSVQELLIKSFDKFFSENGYESILHMSSSNKNNFLKCCYFTFAGKHHSFSEEYYFDSNDLADRTVEVTYRSGTPPKFDNYTLQKINEVILNE